MPCAGVLLVPAAGIALCLVANNHGAGVLTGCVLGAAFALLPGRTRIAIPVPDRARSPAACPPSNTERPNTERP